MLRYRELPPAPALAPYVQCYWTMSGELAPAAPRRILPDGSFEWIFHLGQPFAQNGIVQPRAFVVGQIRRAVLLETSARPDVFGIRFRAGGAARFVRVPMRELEGLIVSLPDLGLVIPREPCVAVVDAWLTRLMLDPRGEATARAAVSLIRASGGAIRVRELANRLGTTERTLARAFEDCVGMTPKVFARLTRFHMALRHGPFAASYADESHFIRDAHDFAGTTPSVLRSEENDFNDAFVGNVQDAQQERA